MATALVGCSRGNLEEVVGMTTELGDGKGRAGKIFGLGGRMGRVCEGEEGGRKEGEDREEGVVSV